MDIKSMSKFSSKNQVNIPVYQCTSIPLYRCTSVPMYQYSNIPIYHHTSQGWVKVLSCALKHFINKSICACAYIYLIFLVSSLYLINNFSGIIVLQVVLEVLSKCFGLMLKHFLCKCFKNCLCFKYLTPCGTSIAMYRYTVISIDIL